MAKRGRPPVFDEQGYSQMRLIYQTDSKRSIQNNLYKAKASLVLCDYVLEGNDIPHFDYILDAASFKKGDKYSFTYKQTVFTELGRLYNYIASKEDEKMALDFLVKFAGNLCKFAFEKKLGVREMERLIRDKRREIKEIYER